MPTLDNSPIRLHAESSRVVIRPFQIAPEPRSLHPQESKRVRRIVDAVLALSEDECAGELAEVNRDFQHRHWQTRQVYLHRYDQIAGGLELNGALSETRRELIGAYFCHEYSYASAAIMNPSIVPHPDQSGLSDGSLRVVISLRTVGEGHISSIAFREGILDDAGFALAPSPHFAMSAYSDPEDRLDGGSVTAHRFADASLSGTVIFPMTPAQRNGLEDLRMVRLTRLDGSETYCGTYTAYSGFDIASELMCTDDFRTFTMCPMTGSASKNKGMALFPRPINGRYAMIGRQDGESLYYLESDDLTDWGGGEHLMTPKYPWELLQIGNCGSPVEINEGWLLLTHGVGAMRQYSIGAALLDKDDPRKVLGRLPRPLLTPSDENREGYVPNVVYTCGAIRHGRRLFMPYGVADSSVAFAWVDIPDLLSEMV